MANHPDLVTAAFEKDNLEYPPADQLIADCGKMALLDRLLTKLHAKGHKVDMAACMHGACRREHACPCL